MWGIERQFSYYILNIARLLFCFVLINIIRLHIIKWWQTTVVYIFLTSMFGPLVKHILGKYVYEYTNQTQAMLKMLSSI
jgi:hypothetical protein